MISTIATLLLLSSPIMGRGNSINISTGTHQQYNALDSGYGEFLQRRYGVSGLTTTGSQDSFLFKLDEFKNLWIGLEKGEQSGKIKYKDLNGVRRVNDLSLSWLVMLASYQLDEEWQLDGGFGTNVLILKFYGYGDNSINSTNYENNSGRSNTKTRGFLNFGQITYSLTDRKRNFFDLSFSYRFTYSGLTIKSTDDRPALNKKGVPIRTVFDVGGHLGLIRFGINF